MTSNIQLPGGYVALVDPEDYDWLNQWRWSVCKDKWLAYASRSYRVGGVSKTDRMHRIICGAASGQIVDHINGDSLDNRRSNLRICTNQQNMANLRRRSLTKSGRKGVQIRDGRIIARITKDGKSMWLGQFASIEEASAAYAAAAKQYFGEFAHHD